MILASSELVCVECDYFYYLNKKECVLRLNRPDECVDYNKEKDECLKCEEGYFLNQTSIDCLPYP